MKILVSAASWPHTDGLVELWGARVKVSDVYVDRLIDSSSEPHVDVFNERFELVDVVLHVAFADSFEIEVGLNFYFVVWQSVGVSSLFFIDQRDSNHVSDDPNSANDVLVL